MALLGRPLAVGSAAAVLLDEDIVRPELLEEHHDACAQPGQQGTHGHHRRDADDNPENGQQRAEAVRRHGQNRDGQVSRKVILMIYSALNASTGSSRAARTPDTSPKRLPRSSRSGQTSTT